MDGPERDATGIPERGSVWLSRAGADALDARLGDMIGIGESQLRLSALVVQEPDAATDYFNIAPRVFLHLADLPATGLVQEGSRLRYRPVVAGEPDAVERFVRTAREGLARGQRLETVKDARPEMRSALDRADRFLSLAALVSVVLAAVAVAMAARRHSERHLSSTAVMRCLGASQRTLVATHGGELLLAGLIASTLGVLLALLLQWVVGRWLSDALKLDIPAAGWVPAVQGYGVGLVVLLTFGAPPSSRCAGCPRCACCAGTSTAPSRAPGWWGSRVWRGWPRCCGGRPARRGWRPRCSSASSPRWACWPLWRGGSSPSCGGCARGCAGACATGWPT
ncbi:ABC transporter permease [Cystobacter fuscus]